MSYKRKRLRFRLPGQLESGLLLVIELAWCEVSTERTIEHPVRCAYFMCQLSNWHTIQGGTPLGARMKVDPPVEWVSVN